MMMTLTHCVTQSIGNTPLLELRHIAKDANRPVALKLESRLPGGSIKDRVGLHLVEDAEAKGLISPEKSILVEPTSGNSGIALAMVAAVKGYRLVIIMPENCSLERRAVMRAYGAELILTPAAKGMNGACAYAKTYVHQTPGAYLLDQFANPANAEIHERTTGPEIWESTGGNISAFVAAVGTGGTLSGVGHFLKKQNPAIRIIAVEPKASPILSEGFSGMHKIQGIGAGFIPKALDTAIIDEVITVDCLEAMAMSRRLAREEGLLSGISSGANTIASLDIANREEGLDGRVVSIQCSGGERYLTSELFKPVVDECQAMPTISLP